MGILLRSVLLSWVMCVLGIILGGILVSVDIRKSCETLGLFAMNGKTYECGVKP